MSLILPENYDPHMTVRETQEAIKYIRDTFQREFGKEMNLERISAPLFVEKSSGLNDNLNGVERPVQFDVAGIPGETVEVVHSLAEIVLVNHDKLESGVLQQQLEEVSYKALPSALVDKVEIDVAELRIGDTIKVKDLSLAQDKDVHLVTDPETTVVTVTESHIAIADDEDSEETE